MFWWNIAPCCARGHEEMVGNIRVISLILDQKHHLENVTSNVFENRSQVYIEY